jgi:hypothetical protein
VWVLNNSITHTNYEQGAWWQVDLGSKKLALIVMSGPTTTLKTFKETEMIATARILVSLFILFFMLKN